MDKRIVRLAIVSLTGLVAVMIVATPTVLANGGLHLSYSPGVQFCDGTNGTPAHNPAVWHPLVLYNGDGSFRCTYGHEHGSPDDAALDSHLGSISIPDSTGHQVTGQSISYPWFTTTPAGVQENGTDNKHRAYKWLADENIPCNDTATDWTSTLNMPYFRGEFHMDGNIGDVPRFHSFYLQAEAQICDAASPDNGEHGTITFGGHQDYAMLMADSEATYLKQADDPCVTGDTRTPCQNNGNPLVCQDGGDSRDSNVLNTAKDVWYGTQSRPPDFNTTPNDLDCFPNSLTNETDGSYGFGPKIQLQNNLSVDSFGPIDNSNPPTSFPNLKFFSVCPCPSHDEMDFGSDVMDVRVSPDPSWVTNEDSHGVWHVVASGKTNRHGIVVTNCAGGPGGGPVSVDCIPFSMDFFTAPAWSWNGSGTPPDILIHASLFVGNGGTPANYTGDVAGPIGGANPTNGYYVKDPG